MKLVDIPEARALLQQNEVVAIPTETVYGLAASIYSQSGLEKIFAVKERPFFDPLIVHVSGIPQAKALTNHWGPIHQRLAEVCWPGPLTLIAPKNEKVHPLITAGLGSVGLRCPDHELTLRLLRDIDGGLAAPSANKFGKTSPVSAAHVQEEFGNRVPILDGGPCIVGIESTVAGVDPQGRFVEIYRPGKFTAAQLRDILRSDFPEVEVRYAESPVAPGQLKHHYMPRIPLVIVSEDFLWDTGRPQVEKSLGRSFYRPVIWQQSPDAILASRELYQRMREFDQQGFDLIVAKKTPEHQDEDWRGIWNRLGKAKTLDLT